MFRVGVTRDFRRPDGSFLFAPVDLRPLEDAPGLTWAYLARDEPELGADLLNGLDALYHLAPKVSAASLEHADRLVLLARSGVGLDAIDVDACTGRGIAVTITPRSVTRPMASAVVALILALAHRLGERTEALRAGGWDEGRFGVEGFGLTGSTLGVIGLGRIGREVVRLLGPWEMTVVATSPSLTDERAAEACAERVDLDTLLRRSDVVVVACPLAPDTHHLLDVRRLSLMKPSAVLVNVARGAIVDQAAMTDALREGRLAGAGLDVFEQEPMAPDDPLRTLPNVVLAPHALGYTDELFSGVVEEACCAILDMAAGRVPEHVVNPAALEQPPFRKKLDAIRQDAR